MQFKYAFILCFLLLFISCQEDELVVYEDIEITLDEEISAETPPNPNTPSVSDDMVKNWISQMQTSSGLLESVENTDFVSLYDNALAAILFIQEDERQKAENIFNFYANKIETELVPNGGFYQFRNSQGEEGERIWMGDNAWLLIALNHYEEKYQSSIYNSLSEHLETWLRSLQNEDGSISGGTNADGTEIPKVTEGMLMAFNAVKGYDDFHKNILNFFSNERWDKELGLLMAWPENPKFAYALDVHSLSKSVFEDMSDDILLQANRYLNTQTITLTGEEISGYCFDDDKDVVWLEGTAQMAVAFNSIGRFDLSDKYINILEKTFITSTLTEEAKGIPYTTNHGTSYGSGILWDHTDIAPALSSSIWYSFAKIKFNPLTLGAQKEIPLEDKFWIQ